MKIIELILSKLAVKIPTTGPNSVNNLPTDSATAVLGGVLDVIYFIVGAVAVVVIILAGYTFLMANGDPAKLTKARMAILYSVIGLIVVIFAFVITGFVLGRLK